MTLPTSTFEAFLRWWRERLPVLPFLGVAFVVCLCAETVTSWSLFVSFVWLAGFRLLDDVFARPHDAVHHPGRAVVRGPPGLYVRAALAAVAVGFVTAIFGDASLFYAGLFCFLLVVGLVPGRLLSERGRALLVLVKYPAIAVALSTSTPTTTPSVWRLILLYLCVVVDEEVTGRLPLPARALPFVGAGLAFFLL